MEEEEEADEDEDEDEEAEEEEEDFLDDAEDEFVMVSHPLLLLILYIMLVEINIIV
jgi:hypothetical protein